MKNVGMTLFFFFSVAMIQLSAQNCQPSPNCNPANCVKACTPDGKSAAVNNKTTDVAALVANLTPAQVEACKTTATTSAACCSKSGKSAALTTTAKATMVSNTNESAPAKKMCTQPCTKSASTQEQ
ncbi:MAG: hypothetical protein ACKV1O_19100 [Saprospiraceae bacterium]